MTGRSLVGVLPWFERVLRCVRGRPGTRTGSDRRFEVSEAIELEVVACAHHHGIQPPAGPDGGLGQDGELPARPGGGHGRAQAPSSSVPEVLLHDVASGEQAAPRLGLAAPDLGVWRLEIHARLRRLRCPEHGVHVEGVPFARGGARFTRDFENLVAWLMTKTDRTASAAGPSGWWRSTTSSTGYGSLRGGESDWRAGRAFARSIGCWARKSGICGWTRLRSTVSTSASISFYCCGILHRVENPLRLLRVLHGRTVNGGTVLIETHGLGPDQQDGGAIRVSLPGEVYAGDEFVYWGVRGRRPRAACPDRGVLRGRPVPFRAGCRPPADHRATGRLTAPGWRPHDFFISWSQTRNGVEGGGSQIDRHASGDRRPPPRPRLRPGLIARGARPFTRAARRRP